MKVRRDRGERSCLEDQGLNDLVVNIAQRRLDGTNSGEEVKRIMSEGNVALDSAAKARKTFRESKFGGKLKK